MFSRDLNYLLVSIIFVVLVFVDELCITIEPGALQRLSVNLNVRAKSRKVTCPTQSSDPAVLLALGPNVLNICKTSSMTSGRQQIIDRLSSIHLTDCLVSNTARIRVYSFSVKAPLVNKITLSVLNSDYGSVAIRSHACKLTEPDMIVRLHY